MLLRELEWKPSVGGTYMRAKVGSHTVTKLPSGNYNIFAASPGMCWWDVDKITAQAILFYITQEGNNASPNP